MSLKQLLNIVTDHDKMCTFGFIREQQKQLNLIAVPMMIQYCCLKYYFEFDQFEKCGSKMQIIGENKMKVEIKESGSGWNTAYCAFLLDPALNQNVIYEWKFKIGDAWNCIGIQSSYDSLDQYLFGWGTVTNTNKVYGLHSNGFLYVGENYIGTTDKFGEGDEITMVMNMRDETLSFRKNSRNLEISLNHKAGLRNTTQFDATKLYHASVCVSRNQNKNHDYYGKPCDSFELIDFKAIYL